MVVENPAGVAYRRTYDDPSRAQTWQQAQADGFERTDCVETETVIEMFEAHVTWECTR